MSEINIDGGLMERGEAGFKRTQEKLVEMQNGCICCTLREDLIKEVAALAKQNKFDYLLIESTGIAEPLPVAQAFTFVDPEGQTLSKIARLDTMVTVVDSFNFHKNLSSVEKVVETVSKNGEEEQTEVPLSQLLIDQIEFANVIVLNKTDLVSGEQLSQIKALIQKLNPSSIVLETLFGDVPLKEIINTKLFDFEKAQMSAGWMKELLKPLHTPETEEFGIKSWIYRRNKPFHPKRFYDFLIAVEDDKEHLFSRCIRAKGTVWLASRHLHSFQFQKAGTLIDFLPLDLWYAELPKEKWGDSAEEIKETQEFLKRVWQDPYGDRSQEIVFIGMDQEQQKMVELLDTVLLSEEEYALGPEVWTTDSVKFEDPFPEEFSEQLLKRHRHIHHGDSDRQQGWEDCLDNGDADEDDMTE